MNKNACFLLGSLLGCLAGSVGTYFFMQKRMAIQIDMVTENLQDYYGSRVAVKKKDEESEEILEKPKDTMHSEVDLIAKKITEERSNENKSIDYTHYRKGSSTEPDVVDKKDDDEKTTPYSISPDDFDEDNGYKKVFLTYYEKDDILAYDSNPTISIDSEEFEPTVGRGFKDAFGDWEKDTCYIRNDISKTDYEIDKCIQSYEKLIDTYYDDEHPTDEEEDK